MGLLDSRPETETTREDLITILAAVVRAYGMQEASGRASKVIVDTHEIASARQAFMNGNVTVYKLDPGAATSLDRPATLSLDRFVIEVTE